MIITDGGWGQIGGGGGGGMWGKWQSRPSIAGTGQEYVCCPWSFTIGDLWVHNTMTLYVCSSLLGPQNNVLQSPLTVRSVEKYSITNSNMCNLSVWDGLILRRVLSSYWTSVLTGRDLGAGHWTIAEISLHCNVHLLALWVRREQLMWQHHLW